MKWERENPYLFLEDLRMKWCKNGGFSRVIRWVWEIVQMGKTMNSQKCSRENWKVLKTDQFTQNMRFSRLSQVTFKLPGLAARTLERKTFEKISKYFSRLEVPLVRESWSEPWKSLCTPRNWTFHPGTNRQPEPRKAWKPRFWKIL